MRRAFVIDAALDQLHHRIDFFVWRGRHIGLGRDGRTCRAGQPRKPIIHARIAFARNDELDSNGRIFEVDRERRILRLICLNQGAQADIVLERNVG